MAKAPASGPTSAPASAPASQPIIRGLNWNTEIGKVYSSDPQERKQLAERRKAFYRLRATHEMGKLKGLQPPSLKAALDDPGRYGLLDFSAIARYSRTFEVPKDAKTAQLSVYLKEFFKQAIKYEDSSMSDADVDVRANREVYLTLHYLHLKGVKDRTGKRINVDFLLPGETVNISNGKLSIFTSTPNAIGGVTYRIDQIALRPMPAKRAPASAPAGSASAPASAPAAGEGEIRGPSVLPPSAPVRQRRKLPASAPAGELHSPPRMPPLASPAPKRRPARAPKPVKGALPAGELRSPSRMPPPVKGAPAAQSNAEIKPSAAEYIPPLSTQLDSANSMLRFLAQKNPDAFGEEKGSHSINYRIRGMMIPQLQDLLKIYEDSQDPEKNVLVVSLKNNIAVLSPDLQRLITDVGDLRDRLQTAISRMERTSEDLKLKQDREKTIISLKEGFAYTEEIRKELMALDSFLVNVKNSLTPVSGRTSLPALPRWTKYYIEILNKLADALDKFSENL